MISIRKISICCLLLLLQGAFVFGNQPSRCSSMEYLQEKMANDPAIVARKLQIENDIKQWIETHKDNRLSQTVITIPCVIFNVYHNNFDSLSQAQLESQIDVLNSDFNATNTDRLSSSHPYFNKIGNAQIVFCIAETDPNGNPTSGIIRKKTTNNFTNASDIKYTNKNGIDGWPADEYLNIWVSDIAQSQFLGQADFPGDFPQGSTHDGLIVQYNAYGNIGTLTAYYDKGRTATHEIGHWLNLKHIWGDANCGDDLIDDTPKQQTANYDCPTFPHVTCSNGPNGDLFMNYMDYTDDACMSMFTKGQVQRMLATLNTTRSSIVTSNKCSGTTSVSQQKYNQVKVFPNPIQNYLVIQGLPQTKSRMFTVEIYNMLGEKVYYNTIDNSQTQLEMVGYKTGTYILNIFNEDFYFTQKLTVVK
mgnify:CR=1 FL=1